MSVYHVSAWYLQGSDKGVGSLGPEVTDCCKPLSGGRNQSNLSSLEKQPVLNH